MAAERPAWHWECSGTCLASAGSWGAGLALDRTRPPVFRTMPRLLHMPGRQDMLARVGLIHRSRVGAFMPDGGDPVTGWLAGFPGTGADCDSKRVLCEGYGFAFPMPRRREAYQGCWPCSGRGAALFRLVPAGWDAGRRLAGGGQA